MDNIKKAQHDIKSNYFNLMYLLKFIKEDGELKNPDNISMLDKLLEKEDSITENIEMISEFINKGK